jgi:MYXO-CTERM domain-containing protein
MREPANGGRDSSNIPERDANRFGFSASHAATPVGVRTLHESGAMTKRRIACFCIALISSLGMVGVARADGVRPDACPAVGEFCSTAPGSPWGICTRSTCNRWGPLECTAGQGGESGQSGAGQAGVEHESPPGEGGCAGFGLLEYECFRCKATAGGGGGTAGRPSSGGSSGSAGRPASGGTSGVGANGGLGGTTGGLGGANGTTEDDSGCGCRIGAGGDEQSVSAFMLLVGFGALGVSRRRARRARE